MSTPLFDAIIDLGLATRSIGGPPIAVQLSSPEMGAAFVDEITRRHPFWTLTARARPPACIPPGHEWADVAGVYVHWPSSRLEGRKSKDDLPAALES